MANLTHSKLVQIAKKWLQRNGCSVAITEMTAMMSNETADAIGFRWEKSVLVECKVSRSDFLSDKKKVFRQFPDQGMGNYRYYMAPKGVLSVDDMPKGWLLLEVSPTGRVIPATEIIHRKMDSHKTKYHFKSNMFAEKMLLQSVVRRLNTKIGDVDEIVHHF